MTQSFASKVESTGEGDLLFFRDAVITYCAALRAKQPFYFSGTTDAADLLRWMGMEFAEGVQGKQYLDPSRLDGSSEAAPLVSASALPRESLADYRDKGYLGTTLFAALVRSSYGPDEPGFFPTQSELGWYFEEAELLRDAARWDAGYLEECQLFFFEELTPAELLEAAAARLGDSAREPIAKYREALEGVAFLIGEQTETLLPLQSFLAELLVSNQPFPELSALLAVEKWDEESIREAWDTGERSASGERLFAQVPLEPALVLLACGRDLIAWRAER